MKQGMSTDAIAGFAVVELVRCFERLGLFEALAQPATAAQLAERSGLPVRPLALTLPILTALGYLEQLGETFRAREAQGALEELPKLRAFLERGEVGDQIDREERRGAYYAKSVLGLGNM